MQLRMLALERERRARAGRTEPIGDAGPEESSLSFTNVVNELNRGLLSLTPQVVQDKAAEFGIGVETDFSATPAGAGVRYMGTGMPFALGAPALGSATPSLSTQTPGVLKTMFNDITKFAMQRPKTYMAAEGAAAFGAGAAGEAAEQAGAGPGGQLAAEFAGGMGLGAVTAMAPQSARAMREGFRANILPMTEEGGMIRAARQMQERAGGPDRAKRYAAELEEIPEGITPARWIGDERLMAQEARILRDNPELQNQVADDLEQAWLTSQQELKDSFGRPRSIQDWEVSVLERVTPEGTMIEPGMSDDMLDQAYQSFRPLYDKAKGHPVSTENLGEKLKAAPFDEEIIATDSERKAIQGWVANQWSAFSRRAENGVISSDEILELRSKVRDQRRSQSKRGNEERADLLGAIEGELTTLLDASLPEEATAILRAADSQYRKYKVVENALFNAGDAALTPEQLSQSIRLGGLTSQSRYARGADEATQELRRLALAGRSTEEVIGDPRRAALFVRDLGDDERRAVQADFVEVLFNRAKESGARATESGNPLISGEKLLTDIVENRQVMQAMGMSGPEINRIQGIGEQVLAMSKKSPAAVAQLFEDGPATILQLAAAISGAKGGQRAAGSGIGSSLVLAQYMSNRARQTLANLTSSEAERLMTDAATDPRLYQAILTRPTIGADNARARAAYMESWLMASAFDKANQEQQ